MWHHVSFKNDKCLDDFSENDMEWKLDECTFRLNVLKWFEW